MKRLVLMVWSPILLAAAAPRARAQDTTAVHIASSYADFNEKEALALIVGYFAGNRGQAGVGPQGGPLVGLSFLYHLTGPAGVIGRVSYAKSKRLVVDPLPTGPVYSGPISAPLVMADVGLAFDVTGEKTWHGMIPTAGFCLGFAFGNSTPDVGGYKFGTKFYIGFGGGLKYDLKGEWVLKMDAWDYLWQLEYPDSYFGATSVLPLGTAPKAWTNNGVLTLGLSYTLKH